MIICGIDEAGRGPVIGPMVMAGIAIKDSNEPYLKKLNVKDSKLLTREQREYLYDKITAIVDDFAIEVVQAFQIDDALRSPTMNLNWLEAITTAKIINKLQPDKAIIDCPSTNIESYRLFLKKEIHTQTQLIIEHKADVNHIVASAASILAKVTRDLEVDNIKQRHGIDFGSGYMSDEKTVNFLNDNFDKYDFIRKSWQSYKNAKNNKEQKRLFDF